MASNFKYILGGIGQGGKIWRCEVCGGDVWRMYFQIELLKGIEGRWTSSNCRNLLGHEKCLRMMQKGSDKNGRDANEDCEHKHGIH